ncbi:MATE family efflux transporter [Apibacter sp. HY039]|uniref:MATE family efflux transporter n=1 Tax=Apibacter sp. HY039 TaxID=2501476 RepID=UPI000FEBAF93|nr:MATE family efflux transporter [Apibacter sp. HY039]
MILPEAKKITELETKNPKNLLWQYAIPAIIGTAVIALYNIIDSIYIGHGPDLGDHAIGGLGILLPVMNLISGLGMLVGSGASARVSILLGQKDIEGARKVIGNSITLAVLLTTTFIITTYIFTNKILYAVGSTEETFFFAKEFLIYYLPGNVFLTVNFALNNIMRASGYPKKAMYTMLIGVFANILLAPVFIFILDWGMKGAAIATNLSIMIGLSVVLIHFLNKKNPLSLKWNYLRWNSRIVWSIINIGFAPFFMLLAASVVVFFINNRLKIFGGSIAIESYTLANRLIMVFIMILVGLTQGMQPIIGYNYGAKKMDRVKQTLNYTIKTGILIGSVGLLVGIVLPDIVIKPFNPSAQLAEEATTALKIMTITLPLSGLQMVISNFFQCIGKALYSFFLSMTRQFIILIPALFILPKFYGIDGIWYSIPLSDLVSTLLAVIILFIQLNHLKKLEIR